MGDGGQTWPPDAPRGVRVPRSRYAHRETPVLCVRNHRPDGLTASVVFPAKSPRAEPGPTRARPCSVTRAGRPVRPTIRAHRHGVSTRAGGLERVYQDRTLTCRDCSEEFTFSAGEQAFFASKGLTNDPQRCPSCRAAAKRARSGEGPREFHAAVCGACGGQAVVPFAPRNDRPVYCSSCFDKVRAGTLDSTPAHV